MNRESADPKIRRLIRGMNGISTFPTIYAKVNELVNNPTTSASELGQVISGDQGLTARILRLVNSAFYGFPSKIDTVSRAVTIIGFKQLRELVLGSSLLTMFKDLGQNISFKMEDFWKHSIACGIASRILAIYAGQENPESHFVAGLLHDIGRLVLLECDCDQYREVFIRAENTGNLIVEGEMDIFGFTHAHVGKELISSWQLPASLSTAIGHHHDPQGGRDSSIHSDIVHISDILIHACEIGCSGEKFVPSLDPEAWKRVGLKKSILEPAFEKIFEQFNDAYAFFTTA